MAQHGDASALHSTAAHQFLVQTLTAVLACRVATSRIASPH